ncbi:DEAD/DEAH box helicase [Shouchella clausii]|uniref:DEAD/DEAH box helicase n=1 Tax=Shouchella clausii TaxID=79880 RepID=A0A268S588_SHOCL|nr:DEAD/DEAH box helicase [Shouchella clausii]PAD43583.1 DEAD/DEAH box helicase [Bacillus sp. 7520-S]MBU8595381.1 DEAD/DEAH box helicase [Shouchella clausii]MEB5480080.1 DEAD/DEAH box helicase [Shouchella clausii]MED4158694.1 DEAD/DEAH box helicase [Shouchella clausii]MED4177041.1 DEAD/DEAH box helicase [Shouchella clausii]
MNAEHFSRLGLNERLLKGLSAIGVKRPTEIQERLIPAILNRKDVIGQSQTGTGKTFAFLLPIIEQLDIDRNEVQAVITAPTRELCAQLFEELKKLIVYYDGQVDAQLFVGGTDRKRQAQRLSTKQPHIVIGTPGRIADLVNTSSLLVYTAKTLVVDEADQMLDMGFLEDVDKVAGRLAEDLQMLVFSATVPEKLQPFLKKYMNNPRHVHVQPEKLAAERVTHQLVPVRHRDKLTVLKETIRGLNPYLAIIFTNTKEQADEVTAALATEDILVDCLHGGLSPRERKKVMKRVEDLSIQYLVATDLAARGIDIKGVTHIINYAFPQDLDFYVHRVGRTARAGADGIALSLYEQSDEAACAKLASRGIVFSFVEFKHGEWTELVKPPVGAGRINRKQPTDTGKAAVEKQTGNRPIRTGGKAKARPKKVKPGYKQKARAAIAKQKKRERRLNARKEK